MDSKKLVVEIPIKLHERMNLASDKMMVTKSALTKIAVNEYCNQVLKRE